MGREIEETNRWDSRAGSVRIKLNTWIVSVLDEEQRREESELNAKEWIVTHLETETLICFMWQMLAQLESLRRHPNNKEDLYTYLFIPRVNSKRRAPDGTSKTRMTVPFWDAVAIFFPSGLNAIAARGPSCAANPQVADRESASKIWTCPVVADPETWRSNKLIKLLYLGRPNNSYRH